MSTGRGRGRQAAWMLGLVIPLFAVTFPAYKAAANGLGVGTASALRFAIGLAVLLPFAVGAVRRMERPWAAAAHGTYGIGLQNIAMMAGIDAGTASLGALVLGLEPVLIALWAAVLIREPPSRPVAVGLGCGLAGVVVVSGILTVGVDGTPVLAVLWLLVTAVTFSLYSVQLRRLRHEPPLGLAAVGVAAGLVVSLPLAGRELAAGTAVQDGAGAGAAAGILWLGVVGSAVGYVGISYILSRIPAATFALALYGLPPLAVGLSWALLGETPALRDAVGGALVLLGVWIATRDTIRNP